MRDKLIIICLLLISFLSAFILTTVFMDVLDKSTGFYSQGIADSNDVSKGLN